MFLTFRKHAGDTENAAETRRLPLPPHNWRSEPAILLRIMSIYTGSRYIMYPAIFHIYRAEFDAKFSLKSLKNHYASCHKGSMSFAWNYLFDGKLGL